jgi:hypothetical protein
LDAGVDGSGAASVHYELAERGGRGVGAVRAADTLDATKGFLARREVIRSIREELAVVVGGADGAGASLAA